MGWSQAVLGKDAKTLTDEDVGSVLDAIEAEHIGGAGVMRQDWGWSTDCDIQRDEHGVLFSGAEFSANTDLPERFIEECKKRNLDVKLGKRV